MATSPQPNSNALQNQATTLKVGLASFSALDTTRVQSMLDVAKRWLRHTWVVSHPDACDMLITKPDENSPESFVALTFKRRLADFRYREKVEHPLRMQILLDLFRLIEDFLELDEPHTPTEPPTKSGFLAQKKKQNPLFSALEAHFDTDIAHTNTWVMLRNGEPWFGVSPSLQKAYINASLADEISDVADTDTYEIRSHKSMEKILLNGDCMPIAEWWWQLGVFLSRFDIAPSLQGERNLYHMTLWPDFGRLAHHANHVRLAAHMSIAPCSIQMLTDATGAKPRHISSLINALWLMQSLETEVVDPSDSDTPEPQQPAVPSIFNKIRAKFKL